MYQVFVKFTSVVYHCLKEILDLLCYYLFPFTICKLSLKYYGKVQPVIYCKFLTNLDKTEESPEKAIYATQSVSAVLMMVFQYTSGAGMLL